MDVFGYKDYRKCLTDWISAQKKGRRLNAAVVSEKIGVHPTFMSQVLKGTKDLSSEQWVSVCRLMDLTDIEFEFLQFLLLANRAGSADLKEFFRGKLDEILGRRLQLQKRLKGHRQLSNEHRSIFYSSWIYSAVRLFCACDGGKNIEAISDEFRIPRAQADQITSFLSSCGLCVKNGDHFELGDQHIHVPSDSPFVIRHHINWRLRALNSLDTTSETELNFTAPMSISKADFGLIREKIVKLIQEAVEIAKKSDAEDVVALNIDFFKAMK